jgi:IS5 family transposase
MQFHLEGLNQLVKEHGVRLRQSYLRVTKCAAMMAGRYAHAKQFNSHRRDCACCAHGSAASFATFAAHRRRRRSEATFEWPLMKANQIRSQQQSQRGFKLYSFHAPKSNASASKASPPYDFGVKASIVTTNARAEGGQFVLHATALPGNPYDGHTLGTIIAATERFTDCAIERAPMSIRGTAATTRPIHAASSSPARSAECSASSSASFGALLRY